jgi:hypothetical protein
MIVPSPIHEAKIKTLMEERLVLLRAVDALLDINMSGGSTDRRDIAAALKPFEVRVLIV